METKHPAGRSTRTATAIRLPTEVLEALHQAADDRDLSVNWLVVRAVEDFLRRLIPAEELRLTRDEATSSHSRIAS